MFRFGFHNTRNRRHRPWRRHAIVFAVAVAVAAVVLALAWLCFNALISLITLD
jgi:energy-converting hydrogenase Eha subunit E